MLVKAKSQSRVLRYTSKQNLFFFITGVKKEVGRGERERGGLLGKIRQSRITIAGSRTNRGDGAAMSLQKKTKKNKNWR